MAEHTLKNSATFNWKGKGRGKVVAICTIQAHRGSGGKLHSFIKHGLTGLLHAAAALPPGKEPLVSIE